MTLSLRAMRYVHAALTQGSLTAAADLLNVAPSAIANALDQAEEVFGLALATRARAKGVSPTMAGRDVRRRIEVLLSSYDEMLTDIADMRSNPVGALAIGYNAPVAPAFLPWIIRPMLESNPGLTVTLTEGDNSSIRDGLLDAKFDVILFVSEFPDPQIATKPLVFAPTYCLCRTDHALAQQGSVTLEQVVREPIVFLDRPAARTYYRDLLESAGRPYRVAATANSTEMARSLVSAGLGVALLNMRPGETSPYAGGAVRCLPLAGASAGVTLSLGFAPGLKRRVVQAFVEASLRYFDGADRTKFVVEAEAT